MPKLISPKYEEQMVREILDLVEDNSIKDNEADMTISQFFKHTLKGMSNNFEKAL